MKRNKERETTTSVAPLLRKLSSMVKVKGAQPRI